VTSKVVLLCLSIHMVFTCYQVFVLLYHGLCYHVCVCVLSCVCLCVIRFEYHWADGTTVKKPIKCSAPKYIDYLMTWVQEQLDDEGIFPSKIGGRSWSQPACSNWWFLLAIFNLCISCLFGFVFRRIVST